jgi:hypothetical protein
MCVEVVDPGRKWTATICGRSEATRSSDIDDQLSKGAAAIVETRKQRFPDFALRPGNPVFGRLAGQRTLTMVANYTAGKTPYTAWAVWVQTEKTRASFGAQAPVAELADLQARFAPVLDSFRAP